ncbi:MAG: hypothetical protein ACE5GE_08415 [Phycisphaerae bacterium]
MRKKIVRTILGLLSAPVLFQVGCLSGTDVRFIAEGQLISFVNTLINASTSDAIRGAIGS